ncbi:MAG TPA: PspA/IM30 family protein [Tahibacter sp.]|uniref:PspA/IM30 family protein n=1 Tax=Tahibacter sp. TaxID=2056211 RepID=UPI002BA60D31|nr:PspA/IM30 family protein [Tahibacter sp.]HSX60195.1 PspA/IM30 family protein [Tahibacter sp.]
MNRFARLLRADVHAVLDRLEEPETLLRQSLREMEDEFAAAVHAAKARELELRQAQTRRRDIDAALMRVAGELDLAFGAGNEALIRSLLRRRLEHERLLRHVDQRGAALETDLAERRRMLDAQRQRLDALRQKAALFDVEPAAAVDAAASPGDFAVSDEDVELALLRERRQRSAP